MHYMFLLYDDEDRFHAMDEAEAGETIAAYMAYGEALEKAGVFVAGEPLDHSKSARRVYQRDDKTSVQDGPFADSKEQIGGFYRVDVKNLDEALDWAARCPCAATGHVEVRPIWSIGG
ncbi:MAG: YciI family protein [Pseudomonadota bacterium]